MLGKFGKKQNIGNVFGTSTLPDPQVAKLQAEAAKMKATALARPSLGKYQGATDKGGALKDVYKLKDPGAVKSPWMDQMLQQQEMMQTQALNRGAQQAATQAAGAQASMARRGGLSSGAAERLAAGAQEQRTLGAQDIYGQGAQQRLGMQTEDMKGERQFQTGLQQSNIQNALTDLGQRQQFDLGKYSEQMKGWAAEQAAKATEGGGGGTVICTALMDVGLVSIEQRRRASEFRKQVSNETYSAYLRWGTPVANAIRLVPALGFVFRPLVRYWTGDRDILAVAQYKFFSLFNKLFVKKNSLVEVK
jgi:hypothetical protein